MQQAVTILLMFFMAAPVQRVETQYPDRTKVTRLETAMNHLTVIELAEPVTLAAAGSPAFKIERRDNKVFIQPLEEGVSTNLFLWTASGRWNYELVPASSAETLHFAIDQQIAAAAQIQGTAVSPVDYTETQSIAEEMLLFAKPIRNLGAKFGSGEVGVFITDVYRKDDQLFIRYMIDNRTKHPYMAVQPEVFTLQAAYLKNSLHTYRYSQVGRELEKKIRSNAQTPVGSIECDVPSEPLPPGETATGILILHVPPSLSGPDPAVLRFVFPLAGGKPTSLTLVL